MFLFILLQPQRCCTAWLSPDNNTLSHTLQLVKASFDWNFHFFVNRYLSSVFFVEDQKIACLKVHFRWHVVESFQGNDTLNESYISVAPVAVKVFTATTFTECVYDIGYCMCSSTSKAVCGIDWILCVMLHWSRLGPGFWWTVRTAYGPSQTDFLYVMIILHWAACEHCVRPRGSPSFSVGLPVCYVYASLGYYGCGHCVRARESSVAVGLPECYVYASLGYYGRGHCVRGVKAPFQPDFPGHHLRGSRLGPSCQVYFTLCTAQAPPSW